MPTFWRAKDTTTGKELKFRSKFDCPAFEDMRQWVATFFRNLELLEVAPWSDAEHAGLFYPVPVQNVRFDVKQRELPPAPRRQSLLIDRRAIPRHSILKGA